MSTTFFLCTKTINLLLIESHRRGKALYLFAYSHKLCYGAYFDIVVSEFKSGRAFRVGFGPGSGLILTKILGPNPKVDKTFGLNSDPRGAFCFKWTKT